MTDFKSDLPIKTGLLLVALSWFTFTSYEFIINIVNGGGPISGFWIFFTDTASCFGLGLRTGAGLIAVITILLYLFREKLAAPEILTSLRWVIILEAGYNFITFFPSAIWAVVAAQSLGDPFAIFMSWTLPCLVEGIVIPIALVKLFLELNLQKPMKNALKWAFITGTFYVLTYWLNNTGNWVLAITERGNQYLTAYSLNIFSFLATAAGLLALTIYTAYIAQKSASVHFTTTNAIRKAGTILALLGLYYLGMYLIWIFFGAVGGWSAWNAWFLGHNVDLWIMTLPLLGLPLLFYGQSIKNQDS